MGRIIHEKAGESKSGAAAADFRLDRAKSRENYSHRKIRGILGGNLLTPGFIAAILEAPATLIVTRILLTFVFWGSGLGLLANFSESIEVFASLGFAQPALVVIATAATQLIGSALVISGRYVWLGAEALGVFTFLTIHLIPNFWAMPDGPQKVNSFHTATEHVSLIGALILISIFMHQRHNRKFS